MSNNIPEVNSERWLCLDDLQGEIWLDVPDYQGLYMVSNYGRIKSVDRILHNIRKRFFPSMILKQQLIQHYYSVTLNKGRKTKSMRVHRIVCSAFHQNDENLPYINHRNENKLDNRAENLEWCTPSYNATYNDAAIKNGLKHRNNRRNSYPVLQYDKSGNFIQEYPSLGEAYRQTGVHFQNIKACFKNGKGRQLTAGGFIWILKNGKVTVDNILSEISDPRTNAVMVEQYSKDGKLIGTYNSIFKASQATGLNPGSISMCSRGIINEAGGYIWKISNFKRINLNKRINPIYNNVCVNQYALNGDFVMKYPSITSAAKSIGVCASSIKQCLNGVTKTCGGYKWMINNDKL